MEQTRTTYFRRAVFLFSYQVSVTNLDSVFSDLGPNIVDLDYFWKVVFVWWVYYFTRDREEPLTLRVFCKITRRKVSFQF